MNSSSNVYVSPFGGQPAQPQRQMQTQAARDPIEIALELAPDFLAYLDLRDSKDDIDALKKSVTSGEVLSIVSFLSKQNQREQDVVIGALLVKAWEFVTTDEAFSNGYGNDGGVMLLLIGMGAWILLRRKKDAA